MEEINSRLKQLKENMVKYDKNMVQPRTKDFNREFFDPNEPSCMPLSQEETRIYRILTGVLPEEDIEDLAREKGIDVKTFKINTDKICPFNPSKNNLGEIIEALKIRFSKVFPIYSDKTANNQIPSIGPNNPDFRKMNEIIVESDKMTNKQVYDLVKKQAKDAVISKYNKYKTQYKIDQKYKELKTINEIVRLKAGNSLNGNEHPMNESVNVLKNIKQRLNEIENDLNKEIENSKNINKTTLEKCDELIKIKDDEDMKLLMMKKTIEDYLIYLKKGYERKIVSFDEMVNQTRALSRELFSIDYLRSQRKY